jgi:hypothetical protein
MGAAQVCPTEIGLTKIGSDQVGPIEIGPGEVHVAEVNAAQVGIAQTNPGEIGAAEIRPNIWMLLPPLIPGMDTLFEKVKMLLIRQLVYLQCLYYTYHNPSHSAQLEYNPLQASEQKYAHSSQIG